MLLWEMVDGVQPFRRIVKVSELVDEVARLAVDPAKFVPEVAAVVTRCLQHDARTRASLDDLAALFKTEPYVAASYSPPHDRKLRWSTLKSKTLQLLRVVDDSSPLQDRVH